MKKTDGWMPLYVGDYLADTQRLTTEQHGAYLLLIMDYWRNGPPDADDETLATITKLPVSQWRKHAPKILRLFRIQDGKLWHKRIEAERQRAGEVSDKRSEAGKRGAAKKWGKSNGEPMANDMANDMANASQTASQNDAPSPSPSPSPCSSTEPSGSVSNRARLDTPLTPGDACKAMRAAGLADTNPGHPTLLALIEAGITAPELHQAAQKALANGAGFAYAMKVAENQRRDAAAAVRDLPPAQVVQPQMLSRAGEQTRVNAEAAKRLIFGDDQP